MPLLVADEARAKHDLQRFILREHKPIFSELCPIVNSDGLGGLGNYQKETAPI